MTFSAVLFSAEEKEEAPRHRKIMTKKMIADLLARTCGLTNLKMPVFIYYK
ncbi:MAG: hypothetical protein PHW46_00330 [Candidatus Omnitrophica bacterium]|nr:hypothetical protein [Candidatus Omnitrophota bacterium]